MTCQRCSAACQGRLCKQCEIERQFEHMTIGDDDTEGDDD
jgi:hypothetical protein